VESKDGGGTVLRTTYTAYDDAGNVSSVTDGDGNVTTYGYNGLDQKTSSTNAMGKATTYSYDGDGDLLSETEPSGDVISDTYDADGELISTSYSDSTPTVSYAYDSLGQKTSMTDGTGTSSWTYNSLGEETSYTNGAGAGVGYGYDLAGNGTSITYPGGDVVTQHFNSADEISSIVDWNSTESTFSYDASGNLTAEVTANGVTNSYSYDPAGNLASISDAKGDTTVFSASYSRNEDSLVTEDTSQPSADEYQYTGLNQVCYAAASNTAGCASAPSGSTAYSYDASGNLTDDNGTQQEFNAGDEFCWSVSGSSTNGCSSPPSGATDYSYGDDGDLTSITPPTGSATSLTYNAANELTSYQLGSGASTTYAYDGNGLRQSKSTGGSTTEFAWNDSGSLPLLLQETTGSDTTSYVYGPTGLPLEEVLPSGATYYSSQDDLGSTRAVTDSSGAVADTDSYDPYGNVTASTGTVQNNLLYCGQSMDSESGLYYLQARYYDPLTGQFTGVDPLVAETGMPYAYTAGDPVNTSDASGLCSWFGCVGQVLNTVSEATGVCLRNPFGGNNGNGGCQTTLSTREGEDGVGLALATGAVALSGGALLGVGAVGLDAGTSGTLGAFVGLTASADDSRNCLAGDDVACVGAGLGIGASGIGALSLFGIDSTAVLGASFALGTSGLGWDLGALLAQWERNFC
jgi:RHS repeat-associated protein